MNTNLTEKLLLTVNSKQIHPNITLSFDRYYEKYADDNRFTFVRFEDRGHNYVFCSEARRKYVEEYCKKYEPWAEEE